MCARPPFIFLIALTMQWLWPPAVALAVEPPSAPAIEKSGNELIDPSLVARGAQHLRDLAGERIVSAKLRPLGRKFKTSLTPPEVPEGSTLSASLARQGLRRLMATGEFAQGYVDAHRADGGVVLEFVVVVRRIVAKVRIKGGALDDRRALAAAQLAEDSEITEPSLRDAVKEIRAHYRRYGYDSAKVSVSTHPTDNPMEVLLDVVIEAGPRRRVSRRIFVIDPKSDRLLGDRKADYEVEAGDVVDEDALVSADNEMAELLHAAGFLEARVKHRIVRQDAYSFLYIYLETGPLYRFSFVGNYRQDENDLIEALGLDGTAVDASPTALVEKLRAYYQDRGFLDVRVGVTTTRTDGGAALDMRLEIVEARPVRVTKRLLPCMPQSAPDGLAADDLMDELDEILEESLPALPLLHEINERAADTIFESEGGGSRARPLRLAPDETYTEASYQRAIGQLEELLNSRGYLNAKVGPVGIFRAECAPLARGGVCAALPLPAYKSPSCRVDALGLPIEEPALDEGYQCVPDPKRGIECAPYMTVQLPIQLGPRMRLYDVLFEGNQAITSQELLEIAAYPLGNAYSTLELETAQGRLVNAYRDRGFAYATIRTEIDISPDRSRARARFVISEHKPVIIDSYEVRGAIRTREHVILGRLSLCQDLASCSLEDKYFKRDLVRESEEQIATLGAFSSVSIALQDPQVPQERKHVIITVVELPSQHIEPSGGFYTGDGLRVGFEYGHRNIAGRAIGLTVRLELSYLPDFLILDEDVRNTFAELEAADQFGIGDRLERRNVGSLRFPDIGLGPRVELVLSGIDVRDNQRDFGRERQALIPTLGYRPWQALAMNLGASVERNNVTLFQTLADPEQVKAVFRNNPLLRVPEGATIALAQRLSGSWDRRDKPLAATRGTLLSLAVEHVSAFPSDDQATITSEFLKVSGRAAGYVPLAQNGLALAISVGAGVNIQLTPDSETYPDRLFFLGGVNNLRGFQLDEVMPQDFADSINSGDLVVDDVVVRGGDVFINPRAELRVPITDLWSTGIFVDAGNVWSDPSALGSFEDFLEWRWTAGAGIRLATPVGPIAIDYGFKLLRNSWEDLGALHFGIGLF